jgi:ribosomal protein S18 acetylase RimI-like enzyme
MQLESTRSLGTTHARHAAHATPARTALTVRAADAADIPAIVRLVNRAYAVEEFFIRGPRTDEAEIAALMTKGSFLVLDHEDSDGELAASVYVKSEGTRGYFGLLAVDDTQQGAGLGRRLVSIAEALCAARGCVAMDLQVVNLRTELRPWYRSLGYQEHGIAPFPDVEVKQPCHFVLMTKPLG